MTTEARNRRSENIDAMSAIEIVDLMNGEDARVVEAVGNQREPIAQAVDVIAQRFRGGGRLFYIGAGTSGRLGVLDASECPPTFSSPPEMVVGVIAGGYGALTRSVEGAEDFPEQAPVDLEAHGFSANDVLVGIATSGTTPYVLGALRFAQSIGAATIGLCCNAESPMVQCADVMIQPIVGPEVVTGSTRLKAGTATKMVLNMLTTGAMVLIGKTYGNLMVDLRPSNAKLRDRSIRIVAELTGLAHDAADRQLEHCGGELKTAIVAQLANVAPEVARRWLKEAGGRLRQALANNSN